MAEEKKNKSGIIWIIIACIVLLVGGYFWTDNYLRNGLTLTLSADKSYYIVTDCPDEKKAVYIPDSYRGKPVKEIGKSAFDNVYNLIDLKIGKNITSIGQYAFRGCRELKKITIPDNVVSIDSWAFEDCNNLTSIKIGNGVSSIGSNCFDGCVNLQYIAKDGADYLGNENNPYIYLAKIDSKDITDFTIDENCKIIAERVFQGASFLENITIGSNIKMINYSAFSGCLNLKNVYITDIEAWCGIFFYDFDCNPLYYAQNLYLNNELLTELIIPDGATSVGQYAFHNYEKLTRVEISDSVESIGEEAFARCPRISSLIMGSGIKSIAEHAFYGCENVDIYITDIAAWCNISIFWSSEYNTYGINSNPLQYAKQIYINNKPTTELVLPESVISIGDYVFANCDILTSVTIPDSVTSIGYRAFGGCNNLNSVIIGKGVETIDSAFDGCKNLTGIYITDMAAWCNIVFEFPSDNPLVVAKNLYLNNELVTELKIPDGITSIGYGVFCGCDSLTSVIISNNVTSIKAYAFAECLNLTSIVIPNSVTSIGGMAFCYCKSLENIVFNGTKTQWNLIEKDDDWNEDISAKKVICTDGTVAI